MYWMAFTMIMKRSKGENTRYLDFFNRKVAAENTYVRCILEASLSPSTRLVRVE